MHLLNLHFGRIKNICHSSHGLIIPLTSFVRSIHTDFEYPDSSQAAPPPQKARSQPSGTPHLQEFSKSHMPKVNSLDSTNFRMGDGSTKKPGLMGKIFGRQGSLDRSTDGGENSDESRNFDPINALNLQPCPFIRPVPGMRMLARDEPNHILSLSRTSPTPHCNTSIGKCRERAEAMINESTISDAEGQSYNQQATYNNGSQLDGKSEDCSTVVDVKKQHEFVVLSSAPIGNAVAVADWTSYIKFYSQVSNIQVFDIYASPSQ